MATKATFISLGPAALEILRAERRLNARERANTPEAKDKAKRQRLIREGAAKYDKDTNTGVIFDHDGEALTMTQDDIDYMHKKEQERVERVELVHKMFNKTAAYLADYTPVDSGNLFRSIYSDCKDDYFIIGFDLRKAPYAVYQHEETTLHHTNGIAKFLQQAVIDASMVVDSKRKLSVNITIKGLHEGATLEIQVGKHNSGNLDSILKEKSKDKSLRKAAKAEFNHDYWSDIDTVRELESMFSDTDLLDKKQLQEYMSNRRAGSKALEKISDIDLQNILTNAIKSSNSEEATAAYAALLMKRRLSRKKAIMKYKLAKRLGMTREES